MIWKQDIYESQTSHNINNNFNVFVLLYLQTVSILIL